MNDQEYVYLKNKIYKLTNLDINSYKNQQMRRRLDAFVAKMNYPGVIEYCNMLEKSPEAQRQILDYMAINVSEFFRDVTHFQTLQKVILPKLLSVSQRLNIWSAACSCGQEPYTIAMILEEISPFSMHRILATDLDESALEQARNGGPYTTLDIRNIDKNLLKKYFTQNEAGYWINQKIKNKVIFKHHNLLFDPFEHNYDLIVCRNVIIYFSDSVRDKLYTQFRDCLKPGGVLFLGGSEVVLRPGQQGFSMILPSFYRRAEADSANCRAARDLSEVRR